MGRDRDGVREASSSSYEISFTFRGKRCRERIKIKPSPSNLKKVTNHLGSINDLISKGQFDYSETFPDSPRRFQFLAEKGCVITVQDYLLTWLDRRKQKLKASTWNDYNKTAKGVLIPYLGNIALSDLDRVHVKNMLLNYDVGRSRLSAIQVVLRGALSAAVTDELLSKNIMHDWKFAVEDLPDTISDVDPFSKEEQRMILSKLTGQGLNLIQFALWTGLRTSELIALDWDDIDWVRKEVRVTKATTSASRGAVEKPKTKSSVRSVKLLAPALKALLAQKEFTFLAGKEIFQNPKNLKRWSGDHPIRERLWKVALRRAGVLYRRPYQTRHTYASMMLSAGEPPMWVAEQMGHKDWGMIRTVYGKYMPDAIPDAGEKAVNIYGENAVQNAVKASAFVGDSQ